MLFQIRRNLLSYSYLEAGIIETISAYVFEIYLFMLYHSHFIPQACELLRYILEIGFLTKGA